MLLLRAVPQRKARRSVRGDSALNANGARDDSNLFSLDGVYNGYPKLNSAAIPSSVDAIHEFEVTTRTYVASSRAMPVRRSTWCSRAGTNQIHGTAYEFFRNAALTARNFFAPANRAVPAIPAQPVRVLPRRSPPFAIAHSCSPITKAGARNEGITRVTNVPTALERIGDFSQSGHVFIIDPFPRSVSRTTAFRASRQHPIGFAIAALYPLPNRNAAGQNYVSSPTQRDRNDQFDARLDHPVECRFTIFRSAIVSPIAPFFQPFATGSPLSRPSGLTATAFRAARRTPLRAIRTPSARPSSTKRASHSPASPRRCCQQITAGEPPGRPARDLSAPARRRIELYYRARLLVARQRRQ